MLICVAESSGNIALALRNVCRVLSSFWKLVNGIKELCLLKWIFMTALSWNDFEQGRPAMRIVLAELLSSSKTSSFQDIPFQWLILIWPSWREFSEPMLMLWLLAKWIRGAPWVGYCDNHTEEHEVDWTVTGVWHRCGKLFEDEWQSGDLLCSVSLVWSDPVVTCCAIVHETKDTKMTWMVGDL